MERNLELTDDIRAQITALGVEVAEAFHDWKTKSEKPEQDLDMQEVSDAWDLLMFREEKYRELTEPFRSDAGCIDCP